MYGLNLRQSAIRILEATVIALALLWHVAYFVGWHGGGTELSQSFPVAFVWCPITCLALMLVLAFVYLRNGIGHSIAFWTALGAGFSSWAAWWLWQGV